MNAFHQRRFLAVLNAALSASKLRVCAVDTGISAATLSRIARGINPPNLDHFLALCAWMRIRPVAFIGDAIPDCAECVELRRRLAAIRSLVEEQ